MRSPAAVLVLALALAGPSQGAPPDPAPRPAAASRLADLSFLTGRWVGEDSQPFSEESWGAAAGDSMVGTWRLVSNGRTKLFELLTLVEEEERVTLRLRHFDRHALAWEEKDAPLVLPLVEKGPGLAVFEGKTAAGFLRLTYRREGEVLEATLEKPKERQSYRFRKAR